MTKKHICKAAHLRKTEGGGLVSVSESPIECTGGRFLNEIFPLLQLRLDA